MESPGGQGGRRDPGGGKIASTSARRDRAPSRTSAGHWLEGARAKKAEEVALFRYSVISEAISERLGPAERGMVVRALAGRTWVTPEGTERTFFRKTVARWVKAYRSHRLAGLEPVPRSDKGRPRTELATWLAEAARMRRTPTTSSPGPARCSASASRTPGPTAHKAAANRSASTPTSGARSSPRWSRGASPAWRS